jgi:hypothetical protein
MIFHEPVLADLDAIALDHEARTLFLSATAKRLSREGRGARFALAPICPSRRSLRSPATPPCSGRSMPDCWWCAHDPKRAAENLRQGWEHTLREGVDEPGVFPVAPKLMDALVELGELDQADAVTARLRALAEGQQHPWGTVTASRRRAVVRLASGRDRDARPPQWFRRPPITSGWACPSTGLAHCSAWVGRSGG